MLDHCDLFISSDKKPGVADVLESLEEELEPLEETKEGGIPGQPPESMKPTQEKPDHAL